MQIEVSAPTRIDIAGGTLDLWPIHQLLSEATTVNMGVGLPATVKVALTGTQKSILSSKDLNEEVSGSIAELEQQNRLPLLCKFLKAVWLPEYPGISIETSAKSPAGAGLGGSSCLSVCVVRAIDELRVRLGYVSKPLSEREIVWLARDVEANLINIPTGEQDYWGAMRGGINIMTYPPGRVSVDTLQGENLVFFKERLILCYSGVSRASATNNWHIFKRFFDGDEALRTTFGKIGNAATRCADALRQGRPDLAVECSKEEWALRVALWPEVETIETKKLGEAAVEAGASLARVCGAGGGGVMAIFAEPGVRSAVRESLEQSGGEILDATVGDAGQVCSVTD